MVRRSSVIFAASLAVLSTLEPALAFAAAVPAKHRDEVERPRFLKKEIKRFVFSNTTTTSRGAEGPGGGESSSSDFETLADTLTTPPAESTEVVPETTAAPTITQTSQVHDAQWSQWEFSHSITPGDEQFSDQQSHTVPSTAAPLAISPPVTSNTEGGATQPTTVVGNTETSATIAPGVIGSSESAGEGSITSAQSPAQSSASQSPASQPTKQSDTGSPAGSTTSQPSAPTVPGQTKTSGEESTAGTTQPSDTHAGVPTIYLSTSGQVENSGSLSGSQHSATTAPLPSDSNGGLPIATLATSASPATESYGGLPTATPATSVVPTPESNAGQQTLPTTADTQPSATSKPTTGFTERTVPNVTPQEQNTAVQPTNTQPSAGEVIAPTVTQNTQPGTTENSQSSPISAVENSITPPVPTVDHSSSSAGQQTVTNAPTEKTNSFSNGPESTQPNGTQDQQLTAKASAPTLSTPNQQPFTQPAQTQTNGVTSNPTHASTASEAAGRPPVTNPVVPSNTADTASPVGETGKSNPVSAIEKTSPNDQLSANTVPTTSPDSGAPANTKTTQNGIIPTLGASVGASVSPQHASSPAAPESAVVIPSATENKPNITPGAGEINSAATAVQQGTSKAGVLFPGSQSNPANPASTGNPEESTPTGTQLYNALTNALQNTVGPGSTMLANGVVVPTAESNGGSVLPVSHPAQQTGAGQETGTPEQQTGAPQQTGSPQQSGAPQQTGASEEQSGPQGQQTGAPQQSGAPVQQSGVPQSVASGQQTEAPQQSGAPVQQSGAPQSVASGQQSGATVQKSGSPQSVVLGQQSGAPVQQSGAPQSAASRQQSGGTVQQSGAPQSVTAVPSVTPPGGSVIAKPSNPPETILPEGSGAASITLPGGNVVSNPFVVSTLAAVSGVQAVTSNGVVVPNPSASSPLLLPASVTLSNGNVIPNPAATILPSDVLPSNAQKTVATPVASGATGPLVSDTALPVSELLNPSASIPGGIVAAVSDTPQGSGAPLQASATNSNGVVMPISVQSNLPVITGAIQSEPATLPNGVVVSGSAVAPVSDTLPSGGAVPISGGTSPVVVGSATNTNSEVVPITAGQVTGSSALSGGAVVPLTAPTPTAGPASGLPVSSGIGSGSNTLSGGAIVPIASGTVAPSAATGQKTDFAGLTGAGQNTAGQTAGATEASGPGASVVPQSGLGTQAAPAPVTGTATAPPNAVGSVQPNFPSDGKGPFTQQPTGWDSATVQSVPTSIVVEPSSMSPSQTSDYGPTGLPTGEPVVINPPGGPVKRPDNTDLIQIGFLYPLNYQFVWTNPESQQQIFKYLPMGIAWGLQLDTENVTMQTLRAWDTSQDLHYITTLALAWIPSGLVDTLGLQVHASNSRFYHTPNDSTNTLLSMINIALPIAADNSTDGGDSTTSGSMPSSSSTMKDSGAPVGGGIGSTNPVRASSVGIGVGVACGAAAYGAAMFFVARRYKKRRQSHLRSPSMFSSPVMSHVGPDTGAGAALMSGGMGDHRSPSPYHDEDGRAGSRGSGRSGSTGRQQISAPVMAENSLGWN